MQAAKPRARARSSMQVDTRNAVKVRSTDPSSERIHAESKGAQATAARTALALGPRELQKARSQVSLGGGSSARLYQGRLDAGRPH